MFKNRAIIQAVLSMTPIVAAYFVFLLSSYALIPDWIVFLVLSWIVPPMILIETIFSAVANGTLLELMSFAIVALFFFFWGWLVHSLIDDTKAAFVAWAFGLVVYTIIGFVITMNNLLNKLL